MERWKVWIGLTDARYAPLLLAPVLVGTCYALYDGFRLRWVPLLLVVVGAGLAFLGLAALTALLEFLSDDADTGDGYPHPPTGTSRLAGGTAYPGEALILAGACLMLAGGAAILLAPRSGSGGLLLGLIGTLAAVAYALPHLGLQALGYGLAEAAVALLFGPLPVLGAYYAHSGRFTVGAVLASLPLGLLAAGGSYWRYFAREPQDIQRGRLSPVVLLGRERARLFGVALPLAAYLCVAVNVVLEEYPAAGFIALLASVPLVHAWFRVEPTRPGYRRLAEITAWVYGASGLLIALGLGLG